MPLHQQYSNLMIIWIPYCGIDGRGIIRPLIRLRYSQYDNPSNDILITI